MAHIRRDQLCALGIHYIMYPLDYMLDGHAAAGFNKIELIGEAPHFYMDQAWNQDPDEVRKKVEDRGMTVALFTPECSCMQWRCNYADADAHHRSMEFLKRAMEVAVRLGTQLMTVNACGGTQDEGHDQALERAVRHFEEIVAYASEAGLTLGLEEVRPQESNVCTTLDDVAMVIEAVDSPALCATLDTVAMGVAGETPRQWFQRLGKKIVHTHFVDGKPYGHLVWGDGLYPLERYLGVLNEFGYQGLLGQEITDGRYLDDPREADRRAFEAFAPYFVDEEDMR